MPRRVWMQQWRQLGRQGRSQWWFYFRKGKIWIGEWEWIWKRSWEWKKLSKWRHSYTQNSSSNSQIPFPSNCRRFTTNYLLPDWSCRRSFKTPSTSWIVLWSHSTNEVLFRWERNILLTWLPKKRGLFIRSMEEMFHTSTMKPKDVTVDLASGGKASVSIFNIEAMILFTSPRWDTNMTREHSKRLQYLHWKTNKTN